MHGLSEFWLRGLRGMINFSWNFNIVPTPPVSIVAELRIRGTGRSLRIRPGQGAKTHAELEYASDHSNEPSGKFITT